MREVCADFNDLAHETCRGEPSPRVPLGYEGSHADLTGLGEAKSAPPASATRGDPRSRAQERGRR